MFSSDRNINTIYNLVSQLKKYVELRTENMQLNTVEFLTLLFSRILIFIALLIPILFVLLFLTLIATLLLVKLFAGSWIAASFVMCLVYVMLGLIIYINRTKWFVNPLTDYIAKSILTHQPIDQSSKEL